MESIGDILQGLARQRGRSDTSPLLLWHPIAATDGARVSHVPISQHLSQAWIKLTGDPFRPHQSLALTTLRRGDPIALAGASAAGAATARLLLFEMLRAEPDATALILLPDLQMAHDQIAQLQSLNEELGNTLTIATIGPGGSAIHAARARIVLTTPAQLHGRLLRYHDRIWRPFWHNLRAIWLDEAHAYTGVAAAHVGALLLRGSRLRASNDHPLQMIATLSAVADADAMLAMLWGAPWRLVPVDDMPTPATALAVWRGNSERLRDAVTLAQALVRAGYSTHLTCAPLDEQALRQLLGDDTESLTLSTWLRPARAQILVGYPGSRATLQRALASGADAIVLVLGDQPCDTMLARLPNTLLADALPAWPAPPANVYVSLYHLLCAANEQPLTGDEIEHWQMHTLIERMERQGQIVALPGSNPAWQPLVPPDQPRNDPYSGFALHTAGGLPTLVITEQGQILEQFDTTAFDRWGYPGASLPPGAARYRVIERDDEHGTLTVRTEVSGRRTHPLRRCEISIRDQQEQRPLRDGRTVAWGRIHVGEEVYGFREAKPGSPPAERTLSPPLSASWTAHGMWIDVGITPATNGQCVGWSLVHALPLRVLCRFSDIVPVYDVESRRLFLVDAQPGGNGLSAWVYNHLEELLPLAYDIALDCRSDPLLEPSARADMDWLIVLLGGDGRPPKQSEPLPEPEQPEPLPEPQPVSINDTEPSHQSTATARGIAATSPSEPVARHELPVLPSPPASSVRPADQRPQPGAGAKKSKGRIPPTNGSRKGRSPTPSRRDTAANNGVAPQAAQPPITVPPDDDLLPPLPPEQTITMDDDLLPPLPPEQTVPAPAAVPVIPNANAMIERMRLLRQQREKQEPRPAPPQPEQRPTSSAQIRFNIGNAVFCLPYGEGVVRESRIEDDSEILEVAFPEYGILVIDPAISLVRLVENNLPEEEDAL